MKEDNISIPTKTYGILFLILNLYPLSIALRMGVWVKQQKEIAVELLDGSPLPGITLFVFDTYQYYWILPLISATFALLVVLDHKNKKLFASLTLVSTFVVTFILLALKQEALFAPVIQLMEAMGE